MSVNNKWDGITKEDLIAVARNVNIKHPEQIIEQVCDGVSKWSRLAREYDIPDDMVKAIDDTLLYRTIKARSLDA